MPVFYKLLDSRNYIPTGILTNPTHLFANVPVFVLEIPVGYKLLDSRNYIPTGILTNPTHLFANVPVCGSQIPVFLPWNTGI
jgi:hypothetical protein